MADTFDINQTTEFLRQFESQADKAGNEAESSAKQILGLGKTVAEIGLGFSAVTYPASQFISSLGEMKKETGSASTGLLEVGKSFATIKKEVWQMQAYAKGIDVVGKGIEGLGKSANIATGAIQSTGKGLQTVSGWISRFAFNLKDVTTASEKWVQSSSRLVSTMGRVGGSFGKVFLGPLGTAIAATDLAYELFIKKAIKLSDELYEKQKDLASQFQDIYDSIEKTGKLGASHFEALTAGLAQTGVQRGMGTRREILTGMAAGAARGFSVEESARLTEIARVIASEQGKKFTTVITDVMSKAMIATVGQDADTRKEMMLDWRLRAGNIRRMPPGLAATFQEGVAYAGDRFGGIQRGLGLSMRQITERIAGPQYMFERNPIRTMIGEKLPGGWAGLTQMLLRGLMPPIQGFTQLATLSPLLDRATREYHQNRMIAGLRTAKGQTPDISAWTGQSPFGQYAMNLKGLALTTGGLTPEQKFMEKYQGQQQFFEHAGSLTRLNAADLAKKYGKAQSDVEQTELALHALTKMGETDIQDVMEHRNVLIQAIQMTPEQIEKDEDFKTKLARARGFQYGARKEVKALFRLLRQNPDLAKAYREGTTSELEEALENQLEGQKTDAGKILTKLTEEERKRGIAQSQRGAVFAEGEFNQLGHKYTLTDIQATTKAVELETRKILEAEYDIARLEKAQKTRELTEKEQELLARRRSSASESAANLYGTGEERQKIDKLRYELAHGKLKKEEREEKESDLADLEQKAREGTIFGLHEKAKAGEMVDFRLAMVGLQERSRSEGFEKNRYQAMLDQAMLQGNIDKDTYDNLKEKIEEETFPYSEGAQKTVQATLEYTTRAKQVQNIGRQLVLEKSLQQLEKGELIPRAIAKGTRQGFVTGEQAGLYKNILGTDDTYVRDYLKKILKMKEEAYQQEVQMTLQYTSVRLNVIRQHYENAITLDKLRVQGADIRDQYKIDFAQKTGQIQQQYGQIAMAGLTFEDRERAKRYQNVQAGRQEFSSLIGLFGGTVPKHMQMAWQLQDLARSRQERLLGQRREAQGDYATMSGFNRTMAILAQQGITPEMLGQSEGGRQFLMQQYGQIYEPMSRYGRGRGVQRQMFGLLGTSQQHAVTMLGQQTRERKIREQGLLEEIGAFEGSPEYEKYGGREQWMAKRAELYKSLGMMYSEQGNLPKAQEAFEQFNEIYKQLPDEMKKALEDQQVAIKKTIEASNKWLEGIYKQLGGKGTNADTAKSEKTATGNSIGEITKPESTTTGSTATETTEDGKLGQTTGKEWADPEYQKRTGQVWLERGKGKEITGDNIQRRLGKVHQDFWEKRHDYLVSQGTEEDTIRRWQERRSPEEKINAAAMSESDEWSGRKYTPEGMESGAYFHSPGFNIMPAASTSRGISAAERQKQYQQNLRTQKRMYAAMAKPVSDIWAKPGPSQEQRDRLEERARRSRFVVTNAGYPDYEAEARDRARQRDAERQGMVDKHREQAESLSQTERGQEDLEELYARQARQPSGKQLQAYKDALKKEGWQETQSLGKYKFVNERGDSLNMSVEEMYAASKRWDKQQRALGQTPGAPPEGYNELPKEVQAGDKMFTAAEKMENAADKLSNMKIHIQAGQSMTVTPGGKGAY